MLIWSQDRGVIKLTLGDRIKELRIDRGLTQVQVAKLLHINGVTYLHYEKNQREPPIAIIVQIAQLFEVSTDYLLGLKDYD